MGAGTLHPENPLGVSSPTNNVQDIELIKFSMHVTTFPQLKTYITGSRYNNTRLVIFSLMSKQ